MTHDEIKVKVAEKAGLTKKQAEDAIKAHLEVLEEGLLTDLEVRLLGIGTLKVKTRESREGRNPKSKEPITIPASVALGLNVSKNFKEKLNTALTVEEVNARLGK